MTKMTQVPKEDFEILSKYHPGEIRYYIDTGTRLTHRRKPTRVTVKRKPVGKKKAAKKKKHSKRDATSTKRPINGTGHGTNKPVRYTGKDAGYEVEGSISKQVEDKVKALFAGDPTRVIGRANLTVMVCRDTGLHKTKVNPAITDLLKREVLTYKAPATA